MKSFLIFALVPLILSIGIIPALPFVEGVERLVGVDLSQREFQCRDGQVLVYHFNANNHICTSLHAAQQWEKYGFAKIVSSTADVPSGEPSRIQGDTPKVQRDTDAPVLANADQVYYNGKVYTVDDEEPWAQAFAIKDGKFIAVGSNEEIRRYQGAISKTEVIDLQDKMVLPSFIDTHQHWDITAKKEQSCPIPGPFDKPTLESTRKKIEECVVAGNDFSGWFVGVGYSESIFPNGANKEFLDEIFPDRPAFMEAENGHDALVNSKALEVLGITKDTEAPPGGKYVKDENGELTGRIIEDPAREFVADQIPFPPNDVSFMVKGYKIAMDKTNENGITGFIESMVSENELPNLEAFLAEHEPTVRGRLAITAVGYGGPGTELYGKDILEMTQKYDLKDWPVMVKIFADGTTEGENSALLEPFANNPEKEYDKLTLPDELFKKVIKDMDEHDIQVKVHANGDKAVRVLLDIFEEIKDERGFNENRHHIAHNAIVDPQDFSRYREIGVPADWIPALGAPSQYYLSQIPILGEERWFEKAYPLGSIYNSGGIVAVGTDWPLTPADPFFNIQVAVTRQDPLDPENDMVLNEKHKFSLPAAIQMYTINGAHIMHLEEITGSIEDGKSADFIIIDRDVFAVPLNEIMNTKILQTFFEGNQVYKRN